MKRTFELCGSIIFLLFFSEGYGQEIVIQPRVDKVYAFVNGAMKLQECFSYGNPKTPIVELEIPAKTQFTISKILDDNYVITISRFERLIGGRYNKKFDKPDSLNKILFNRNYIGKETEEANIYLLLSKKDFLNNCGDMIPQTDFVFGIMTLPIKMRFGSSKIENGKQERYFNFAGQINLGISAGLRLRNYRGSHSVLTGISISSIPVDSLTSKGLIPSESNIAALTWHLGYLYQHKTFQMGLFTGIDYMGGELGTKWVYRNQPWLGIGLGVAILNSEPSTPSPKKTN